MKSRLLSSFLAIAVLMSSLSVTFTASAEEQESVLPIRGSETYLIHRDSPEEIEQKKEQMKENLLAKVEADPDGYQEWLAQKPAAAANGISPMIDQPDIYLPFNLSDVIGGYTKIGDKYNAPGERLSVTLRPNEVIQDMESVLPENFFNIYIGNSPYGEVRYLNDERMVSTHEMEISEPNWSSISVIGCAVSDQYFAPYGDEDDYCAMKEGYTKIYFECMVMEIIADWNPETGETIPSSYYYNQIYPVDVFIGDSIGSSYADLWSVDGELQDWLFESYKSAFCYNSIWEEAQSYDEIDICDLDADLLYGADIELFGSGFHNSSGKEKKIPPVIQYISAYSVDLDFSDSNLTGELPQELSQINAAQLNLDLSENQLSGNIITDYPNVGMGVELTVKDNQFTGFSGTGVNLNMIDLGINFLNQSDISQLVQKGITCYGEDKLYQVGVQDNFITVASGQTVNADFLKNYITISLNGQDYTPDTAASQLELGIVPGESFFNVFSGSGGSYTKKADGIAEAWIGFTKTKDGTPIEPSEAVGGDVLFSTYSTDKFVIDGAVNPADQEVYCGTPASSLNLPAVVQATAITGETRAVNVTWDTSSYKPSTVGTYTIPGTIALTSGVVNPKNIKVQIKVNVRAISISGVTNPADISAAYGTPVNELGLPETVEITYNTGEKDTVSVAWDTSSYQSAVPGTYTLPGTLTLAENVENPNQLKAQVKVTVTPLSVESVTNPVDISVEYGTPVNELSLPTTVEVTYHTGEKEPVSVTWDTSTYNAEQPGDYTFPGTLTLAAGVENPNNIQPEIKVTVKKQRVAGVTNPADISAEYGTPVNELGLPETVEITYNTGEKDTVPVVWDTSSYQSMTPGTYTLPGTLTLAAGVENPDNIRPEIKVTVKKRRVTEVTNPSSIQIIYGTPVEQLGLPETVRITCNVGLPEEVTVTWDTSAYNGTEPGDYTFKGTLVLPEDIENPDNISVLITVVIENPFYNIESILPIADVETAYNTPQSELALPGQATVTLSGDGGQRELDVTWAPENGYDPALVGQPQVFIGTFINLPVDIKNPEGYNATVNVTVKESEGGNIVSFVTKQITAFQSVPLAQIPNLPETVTAYLDNGQTAELPVVWNDTLNPEQVGVQALSGTVTLPEGVTNTDGKLPTLMITVQAASYTVTEITPDSAAASVGAGEASMEELIAAYAPETVEVTMKNNSTGDLIVLSKGLSFSDADNQGFDPNTAGTQKLIGRPEVTSNITVPEEIVFTLQVNISGPSAVTGVMTAMVNSYQEVPFDQIPGVPDKVTVLLENGQQQEVAVQWHPEVFDPHPVGSQLILGDFVNLPGTVTNPNHYQAILQIQIQPASYEITAFADDGVIMEEGIDAGLSLDEVYERMSRHTIEADLLRTSPDDGTTLTKEIPFTIPEELNPDYDPEQATLQILNTALELTDNISNPDNLPFTVFLTTQPVTVAGEIEYIEMTTEEGTLYKDLDLPETIPVNLSNGKTVSIPVEWGSEEDYIPFNGFNIIEGTLILPSYIDEYTEPVYVFVTEIPAEKLTLAEISPERIPETGAVSVNLGASLEEIYNALETHTVEIILEDSEGNRTTQNVTFTLTEEDNPDYDPMRQGEQTLTASLNLPANVENPDALTLQIAVELKVYTIKSAKTVLITGIAAGTPFAEIGLPEKAGVNYTDGSTGELPVTWTQSDYQPNKIGAQKINGVFTEPLPPYALNPNNRQPYAAITVVNPKVRIVSAIQLPAVSPMGIVDETQEIPGFEEYLFSVELEHEDGSITTEIISVLKPVETDQ